LNAIDFSGLPVNNNALQAFNFSVHRRMRDPALALQMPLNPFFRIHYSIP